MFEYLLVTVLLANYTSQSPSITTTRVSTLEECQFVATTIKKDLGTNVNKAIINCIKVNKVGK
jgi:hypothetical protein